MVAAPKFKRKFSLAENINNGKKIKGMLRLVPGTVKCCCGSSTIYLPVKIVGFKVGDCEAQLVVETATTEILTFGKHEKSFEISPSKFFADADEVQRYEAHAKTKKAMEDEASKFVGNGRHSITLRGKRNALDLLMAETKDLELKAEIEAEAADVGGMSKLTEGLVSRYGSRLIQQKYFPGFVIADDSDDNDDDDWGTNFRVA